MKVKQDIVLRPRFKLSLDQSAEKLLAAFKAASDPSGFITTQVDAHVFIKIPKARQQYWSPQLDLVINPLDNKTSEIRGLFGPSSTVWTLFMFLHFIVAVLFLSCGVWAYFNYALDESIALPIALMLLMVLAWFSLYFIGRMGKATGRGQMLELHKFMWEVINQD
ncbi:GTP-binding protein [Gilvibacter sp.]|uniref:GTP-binding protein n=1 Tax=Gilvibacter sp. TaxID=2729997 RepID=UPI0025C21D46|nr:GTP-binding protein [Gilvibacter sp.]NQX77586.1 GTP-binding protein [Gilvibacter sp.]